MAELDHNYLGSLVEIARSGNSDAFAELYAATYQKQYRFACCYLKDEFLAQDALQETYITALKNLGTLKDPKLFVSWLNQINFRVCYAMSNRQAKYNREMEVYSAGEQAATAVGGSPQDQLVKIDENNYILQQVLALPYSESQTVFLHYYKDMKLDAIADLLEMSRSTVKRHLAEGKKRLRQSLV